MKTWLGTLILTVKAFGLACLSFMSTAGAQGLPCHEVLLDKPDCTACELSLEAWDEPLVSTDFVEAPKLEMVIIVEWQKPLAVALNNLFQTEVQVSRAPPDIPESVSLQAWQQTIRLRL